MIFNDAKVMLRFVVAEAKTGEECFALDMECFFHELGGNCKVGSFDLEGISASLFASGLKLDRDWGLDNTEFRHFCLDAVGAEFFGQVVGSLGCSALAWGKPNEVANNSCVDDIVRPFVLVKSDIVLLKKGKKGSTNRSNGDRSRVNCCCEASLWVCCWGVDWAFGCFECESCKEGGIVNPCRNVDRRANRVVVVVDDRDSINSL